MQLNETIRAKIKYRLVPLILNSIQIREKTNKYFQSQKNIQISFYLAMYLRRAIYEPSAETEAE